MLKVFVLLRLPFSILFLGGFVRALGELGADGQFLGFFCLFGLLVFLAVASIRFAWRRRGGLHLAGLLLALEVVGAVLLLGDAPIAGLGQGKVVAWGCTVLLLWALPNAAILYKARALFTGPDTKKPGD